MGHNRLGRLSRAQPWREVIELLRSGEDVSDIADATMLAAARGLEKIGHDPGFVHTLTTIFKFVEAASSKDFEGELKKNGFAVPTGASFFDVIGSFRERLDTDLSQQRVRSDVAEIAQNAFSETLVKYVMSDSPSLFAETADSVQNSLKKHLIGKSFKGLMHEFFSNVTSRYLSYYISREVSNFVGPGSSLANIDAHRRFDQAFDLYVRQSIRIADEFTPGWYGKAKYEERLTNEAVSGYAHVAFEKIHKEFTRGHA